MPIQQETKTLVHAWFHLALLTWAGLATYFVFNPRQAPAPVAEAPALFFQTPAGARIMALQADGEIVLRGHKIGHDDELGALVTAHLAQQKQQQEAQAKVPPLPTPKPSPAPKRERRKFPPGDQE